MKRLMMLAMTIGVLASWPLAAQEKHMHGDKMAGDYCSRHCNAMELGKEVKALEQKIEAEKAALQKPGSGAKLATLEAEKEQIRRHLRQHERELEDLTRDLEQAGKGLEKK